MYQRACDDGFVGGVWNLNHEYTHYLDGRYDMKGDFARRDRRPGHLVDRGRRRVRLLHLPRRHRHRGGHRGGQAHLRAEHAVAEHLRQLRRDPHLPVGLPRRPLHVREAPGRRRHHARPRSAPVTTGRLRRLQHDHRHPLRRRLRRLARPPARPAPARPAGRRRPRPAPTRTPGSWARTARAPANRPRPARSTTSTSTSRPALRR